MKYLEVSIENIKECLKLNPVVNIIAPGRTSAVSILQPEEGKFVVRDRTRILTQDEFLPFVEKMNQGGCKIEL